MKTGKYTHSKGIYHSIISNIKKGLIIGLFAILSGCYNNNNIDKIRQLANPHNPIKTTIEDLVKNGRKYKKKLVEVSGYPEYIEFVRGMVDTPDQYFYILDTVKIRLYDKKGNYILVTSITNPQYRTSYDLDALKECLTKLIKDLDESYPGPRVEPDIPIIIKLHEKTKKEEEGKSPLELAEYYKDLAKLAVEEARKYRKLGMFDEADHYINLAEEYSRKVKNFLKGKQEKVNPLVTVRGLYFNDHEVGLSIGEIDRGGDTYDLVKFP